MAKCRRCGYITILWSECCKNGITEKRKTNCLGDVRGQEELFINMTFELRLWRWFFRVENQGGTIIVIGTTQAKTQRQKSANMFWEWWVVLYCWNSGFSRVEVRNELERSVQTISWRPWMSCWDLWISFYWLQWDAVKSVIEMEGISGGSDGKESACQCRRPGFDPWVGNIWSLEKGKVTYSSILAWRLSWTEEPGRLQSVGLQSWTQLSNSHTHTHTHTQMENTLVVARS